MSNRWRASSSPGGLATADLFSIEFGSGETPVVMLHGFGASHQAWSDVVGVIGEGRHIIVYDLPGHARSLLHPHGSAVAVARSVLADLEERGVVRAHWVGHSFGGAAAALAALLQPRRAASLTLLAPGGFGGEINHRLLRRYAAVSEEAEIALLLEQFFGWEQPLPVGMAASLARDRQRPGAVEALGRIVDTFFDGNRQKVLATDDLAQLSVPIKVLWGTQDRVVPTRQAHKLPGRIAVHIFEATGHMLPQELPEAVAYLILENTR